MFKTDDELLRYTSFLFSIYLFPMMYILTFVASLALGKLVFIFPVGLTMFWIWLIYTSNKSYDLEKTSDYKEELEEVEKIK